MKKNLLFFLILPLFTLPVSAQQKSKAKIIAEKKHSRCSTMEYMAEAIRKDPTLPEKWKIEGQKRYNAYLQRKASGRVAGTEADEVIIPVVFHLVDSAQRIAGITDRDIYEQVEILNKSYAGKKADQYKHVIPAEITARVGRISLKFVLARRAPDGTLTTGIERRINATPDHVSIKSTATGGLDAWDDTKYLNVWAGTFSGLENGLLGIATFPFSTDQGPQGVVIGIATIPYTSPTARGYYPEYSEGSTLTHEIGHYFYLFHTFGDETFCNNLDFRLQDGWPLPTGAGPEGDDTPDQQAGPGNAYFGNPSENFKGECTTVPYGIVYGSFMNYFDDRALFMFTDGMRKRVEGCLNLYRPGLLTTNGATPPVDVTDAFMVTVTPRGTPERPAYITGNTAFSALVRNTGTGNLTSVTVNVNVDGLNLLPVTFPLSLAPGADTTLNLAAIGAAAGRHVLKVATSLPNGGVDMFTNNDTLYSYIFIQSSMAAAPLSEDFSETTFPPAGWQIWNPNQNLTWQRDTISGFTATGSATVQNFDYTGRGQLDELVLPAIDLGTSDSASLTFDVAYAVYDDVDVSTWDGLEVYVSGDEGATYTLVYKKTGNQLKTYVPALGTPFTATPAQSQLWRTENISLNSYIVPGKKMLIKFRNTTAYGNNTYIDDISVNKGTLLTRDAYPVSITGVPAINCTNTISPVILFGTNGTDTLKSLVINYQVDNNAVAMATWTGALTKGDTSRFPLDAITNISPGQHTLTVFTSMPNGLPDERTSNDTLSQVFALASTVSAPLAEGFESPAFPPVNWVIDNPDGSLTWERSTAAAKTGVASMVLNNFDYTTSNTIDRFVSPIITTSSIDYDSLFISFDYAYSQGAKYPGSTNTPLDTLEVQVTKDCGQTVTTIFKKWGEELQTIGDPNFATANRFAPKSAAQWKSVNYYLNPVTDNQNFQVFFVAKSNAQNNLYVDNINIYTKVLPKRLKEQGYLIYPSPFNSTFVIRNFRVPTTLQSVGVYNSIGQLVWAKDLNGTGNTEMTVDLGKLAAGVYTVKLKYTEKTVVERIVKL